MTDTYADSQDYVRSSTKLVGTYLGLTKEDLLSAYGHPFNALNDEAQLAAALEARTEDLLAKFAPPPTTEKESARMLQSTRSAADGALNELTGSYGHLVEEGVRALLDAHEDQEQVALAMNTLHEASSTMVITDLERLSDVIGLLMIVGSAEARQASALEHAAQDSAQDNQNATRVRTHPQALSLRQPVRDYQALTAQDRHILSDTAQRHQQKHQQ